MNKITLEQMIIIAKAGFSEFISNLIKYDECKLYVGSDIYRLYHKDTEFGTLLPKEDYFSVHIDNGFVQINAGYEMFNHYKAIKVMEGMGLIDE